mmetsp:Transcript_4222/g.9072  ORF Transcript_4222/g.9072 Transcript_4222/m.9072 type:complete len:115 (+) Transcript_4222:3-347(+)
MDVGGGIGMGMGMGMGIHMDMDVSHAAMEENYMSDLSSITDSMGGYGSVPSLGHTEASTATEQTPATCTNGEHAARCHHPKPYHLQERQAEREQVHAHQAREYDGGLYGDGPSE